MQLRLNREDNIIVKSWINDKAITDDTWEVYSNTENSDAITLLVQNKTSNNKFKLEIIKTIQYEDIKKEN
jgi:hypothetical protein